jgi:acyl-coenzyme A synthetase/AMP-(fatty) acid ligase
MSDRLFLHDYRTDSSFSYSQLLADVNALRSIPGYCSTKGLYTTFLTIITAALHKVDLVLLDANFSASELENLHIGPDELIKNRVVPLLQINSIKQLVSHLSDNSNWELTLFTSGTTGIPKQVVHTLKSLTRAVRISERHQNDVWGFAYNPTHMAGLQVFFQALLNGNSLVNLFEAPREQVLALIKEFGITHLSATPTFYRLLLPLQESYESVQKLTSGGEKFDKPLSESLLKGFPNARLRNVYASTEAGTILESRDDTFSIIDEALCKIVEGELLINRAILGESVELALEGDWYATGDLVDVVGSDPVRFRFQSRRNEMINVGGYKVNPLEVEQALEKHPQVRQAYVYGKANSLLGNLLMADIVTEGLVAEKELRVFLTPLLQPFKLPRIINFVKTIDLTRTGKLKRT